jgi:hypothetical protein
MLLLTTAATVLRLTTGSAGEVAVSYSYADNNAGVFSYGGDALTPITGAATTPIVPAPSTGQRNVRQVTVSNTHASVSNLCTVDVYDGTDAIPQWKGTLAPGERVILDEAGDWLYYAADGTLRAGPVAFTSLSDAPSTYVGHAHQIVAVNPGETALDFVGGINAWDVPTLKQVGIEKTHPEGTAGFIASAYQDTDFNNPSSTAEIRCGVEPGNLRAKMYLAVADALNAAADLVIEFVDDNGDVTANAYWRMKLTGLPPLVIEGSTGGLVLNANPIAITGADTTGSDTATFSATNAPAAISPQKWIRIAIDGVDGWVPWFST